MDAELFDSPFNLAGESQSSELTAEAEARVRALAQSEARKAQTTFYDWESSRGGSAVRNFPLNEFETPGV